MEKYLHLTQDEFEITTDPQKMDVNEIHRFLSTESYWAQNIPLEKVQKSVENSLNFGVFKNGKQIGYAKVISDYSTIAYLGDVYIATEHRGVGLSKWLMEAIVSHPELQGLRRWTLLTSDAHELYKKYGWKEIENPEKWMERVNPNVYKMM